MIIKAHASLQTQRGRITTEFEVDDNDIKGMTKNEKRDYIDKLVYQWAEEYIDFGWEEA